MSEELESQLDALIKAKQAKDKEKQSIAAQESAEATANYLEFLKTIEAEVLPAMKHFSELLGQRGFRSEINESRLRGECPEINYNSVLFEIHPSNTSMSHQSSKFEIQREPKKNSLMLKRSIFSPQSGGPTEAERRIGLAELTSSFIGEQLISLMQEML